MVADNGSHEALNGHGRCRAITLSGGECRGFPIRGSGLCFAHLPETQPLLQAGRSRGGLSTARRLRASDMAALDIAQPELALGQIAAGLVGGSLSEATARALTNLVKVRAEIADYRDLAARLEKLEGER